MLHSPMDLSEERKFDLIYRFVFIVGEKWIHHYLTESNNRSAFKVAKGILCTDYVEKNLNK